MDVDVVVVGAGPTGLALACGLRAAGVAVRVLDKAPGPAVTSRALGLQPRGVEVLDRIGVAGDLRQLAVAVSRSILYVNGRELAQLPWAHPGAGIPGLLVISQADVEAALRSRLANLGGTVEWDCHVAGVDGFSDDVLVHLDAGAAIRAKWVVGADGAHSVVRKSAGIDFPGFAVSEGFLLADVDADLGGYARDAVQGWLRRSQPFVAFPLPGDQRWRLMAPTLAGAPADAGPEEIVAQLGALLAEETGATIGSVHWTSSFNIQRRLADTYRAGRMLLVGDAAHIHSPLGAQGLNTGIGDAENLAWKLALVVFGRAEDGLLDSYESERRPLARNVLNATTGVTGLALGDRAIHRLVRGRVAVPMLNRPWVRRRIAAKASQLQISYRHGPLAAKSRRIYSGLAPGDRVPDGDYNDTCGKSVRLHALLGPRWALIGPESLAAPAKQWLGDVAHLPGKGNALLVRPDGHLAWRGSDPTALQLWLDSALGQHVTSLETLAT
jgi:2-polyprenyl-6-methoxyphenol hydroxylase-like FAD-dependent oxidoreductase